ncbi:MAG: SH3 domain-containing protein [Tissierellia bacterium]|nr:SH3 domain-containing protein [Tissierellia bacterium]
MSAPILTLPTKVHLHPKEDVQVIGANLSQLDQDFSLIIDVLNISELNVEEIVFQVKFSDEFGKYLFDGTEFQFVGKDAEALPHKVYFYEPFVLDERFRTARAVEIRIESVDFAGGTHVSYEQEEESAFTLPIISLEKEERIHNIFGEDVVTYGENMVTAWRCVCGATNEREETECRNCGRNKSFVLNQLTEPFMNLKILSDLEGEDGEKVDISFTQTQLTKAPETTQIIQEKRRNLRSKNRRSGFGKKSPLTYLLLLLMVLSLVVGSYAFIESSRNRKHYLESMAKAENYTQEGEYEKALDLYQEIYTKEPSEELSEKIENTDHLTQSKESYELGQRDLENGNYLPALQKFQQVLPEDKIFFKRAQDEIAALEIKILGQSKKLLGEGKKEQSLSLINAYLEVVPESAEAMNLRKSILEPKETSEEEKNKIEIAKNREEAEERQDGTEKDRSAMSELANNLLHSYQTIVAGEANLREEPSLEATILSVLVQGTDVYVYDTLIEGTQRVWCHVEVIEPQGEIREGWVSSRVLERSKNQEKRQATN